eukprot:Phypoly_transcript_03585.p2 GENE.Phypoly_transcript_03585~~Phypoly_transcript_03585.p2  ORF type:complete len:126 (+),score=23.96 Phypoly_transcript_03585:1163-1540(+)
MYKFNVEVGSEILFCIKHENEDVIEIPGFPMPKSKESADVKLVAIFGKDKFKNADISYEYDFGDGWEHSIKFLGIRSPPTLPPLFFVFVVVVVVLFLALVQQKTRSIQFVMGKTVKFVTPTFVIF